MLEKLATIWPEITVAIGACACLLVGLAPDRRLRGTAVWWAGLSILVAALVTMANMGSTDGGFTQSSFVKLSVLGIGLLLLLAAATVPERLRMTRDAESGEDFEPADVVRGEFFAFFLFSLIGVMLCAGANDLVWLFLALELTSLPTYVMVAISRDRVEAQEAAVKYFFLGAMSTAIFLYGFSLIYGVAGTTVFFSPDPAIASIGSFIAQAQAEGQPIPGLMMAGFMLALTGIAFKIAAVPMHFYAADVYQGAATAVTAFLAFVPKTAGFVSMILLLSLVGWPLPEPLMWLLWIMAAATMTLGNVLGLLQSNVKRILAYSSVAHSGYMLVGLVAGPSLAASTTIGQGVSAVLFYLVAYGLATLASFAVLSCLRARGEEAEQLDDLSGLSERHPFLAAIMLASVLSLIGLPPLVGFLGKIYIFGSAIEHEFIVLVVVAVVNSAISAVYYLRIVGACYFGSMRPETSLDVPRGVLVAATVAAFLALALGLSGGQLVEWARQAGVHRNEHATTDVQGWTQISEPLPFEGDGDISEHGRSGWPERGH